MYFFKKLIIEIEEQRSYLGYSQDRVASYVGISQPQYSKMVSGDQKLLNIDVLDRVCKCLHMTLTISCTKARIKG